uniref:Putative secreted protein n=1 Tax=Ixodes scapularis TaxID=6945 RepID=Q4PMY3_IXOSC|nr:putative secreted protein [Ixodes scapularis]
MVDDSMKNTALLFFLMRTTTLIGAMFVLFAMCTTPTVAGADVQSAYTDGHKTNNKKQNIEDRSLVENYREAVKSAYKSKCEEKWPHSKPGALAGCFINCNEQNQDNSTVKIHTLTLSNGSPCIIYGGVCNDGKCVPKVLE